MTTARLGIRLGVELGVGLGLGLGCPPPRARVVADDSEGAGDPTPDQVEGSRADSCAFVEQQTLWLHAGLLGGETEHTFLRR